MRFDGRTAIITGSSGMGLASGLLIAREGGSVHLCGIDEALNDAARRAADGLDVTVHRGDVSEESEVAALVETVAGAGRGIDILVNAAAIQTYGTIETTDTAHWDRVMAVNLRANYLTSRHVYPHMKARGGGAIVHFASVQGFANQNAVLAYATSKGAIHAMTRAMAVDCAADGVRVNSVSPGSVETPLLGEGARRLKAEGETEQDMIDRFGAAHPVGRVGTAAEAAELVGYLVSDAAGFVTGADYRIDGGLTAHIGV